MREDISHSSAENIRCAEDISSKAATKKKAAISHSSAAVMHLRDVEDTDSHSAAVMHLKEEEATDNHSVEVMHLKAEEATDNHSAAVMLLRAEAAMDSHSVRADSASSTLPAMTRMQSIA